MQVINLETVIKNIKHFVELLLLELKIVLFLICNANACSKTFYSCLTASKFLIQNETVSKFRFPNLVRGAKADFNKVVYPREVQESSILGCKD